jgi:L-threonylcarbamoyladenylate synthase
VVRNGAVSLDQLREHVPGVLGLGEIPMAAEEPEELEASDSPETAEGAAEASSAAGSSAVTATDNNAEN